MANGLEKLEKFFGGSRRRERERYRTTQQKVSVVPRQPSSPIFPSPSYLRPTSIHMVAREAQVDAPERDKGRAQSVPELQEALPKRYSVASSLTVVDSHQSPSTPCRSSPLLDDSPSSSGSAPRLSRFRFPEDSLFRNDELMRISGDTFAPDASLEESSRSHQVDPFKGARLLDWTPRHISLLFDPLEVDESFKNHPPNSQDDAAECTSLVPSPLFSRTPISTTEEHKPAPELTPLLAAPPPLPRDSSTRKLTLFPRQHSLSPFWKPHMDSPPMSDSEEDWPRVSIDRSMSLCARPPPRADMTLRPSTGHRSTLGTSREEPRGRIRETWGNRRGDPTISVPQPRNSAGILRSRLRKSASVASLSTLTSHIAKDRVLTEPTFVDFLALSDDDIAESRPETPVADSCIPPTPPPKDESKFGTRGVSRDLSAIPEAQPIAFNPCFGEITPPCTPTNSQLLALKYPAGSPRDTLGAMWAADLAKKYNFDVVYVLSLWPIGGGSYLDPSRRSRPDRPHSRVQDVAVHDAGSIPSHASNMTGRVLAAYGLSEVPSPFEITTEIHINALKCSNWIEYRNHGARTNDISRGWICPFRSDYVPVSNPGDCANIPLGGKNRGMVFAAYVRRACQSAIPIKTSPEQEVVLETLRVDAEAFVEILVDSAPTE
ncbi:Uu.00g044720.m01.CDS01 [Anthostomella pinea]|uniref:Uu.00g044720.m01.CDS01 n=1 Tax=Anthostomella pinea TaxID=933095 RepID=A0AAI8VB00_9PEZI|nr:Uu.00g044720.m01.CDS01 [Anthostomella pinea]